MGLLRKWFGFDSTEAWKQLAAEMDGRYREASWGNGSRVDLDLGDWTVTLDVYVVSNGKTSHSYTRLRAPYVNPAGFRFKVYREGFFSRVGKAFGMQDVEIGVPEFDATWIVQGNDESRLRALFASPGVRNLLEGAGEVSFAVNDDEGWFGKKFPQGVDELVLTTGGIVNDLPRLRLFFALFAETLDRLVATGNAGRGDPGVTL